MDTALPGGGTPGADSPRRPARLRLVAPAAGGVAPALSPPIPPPGPLSTRRRDPTLEATWCYHGRVSAERTARQDNFPGRAATSIRAFVAFYSRKKCHRISPRPRRKMLRFLEDTILPTAGRCAVPQHVPHRRLCGTCCIAHEGNTLLRDRGCVRQTTGKPRHDILYTSADLRRLDFLG